jgi:hypothetical protein
MIPGMQNLEAAREQREQFASMAMQGLLTAHGDKSLTPHDIERIAKDAVDCAAALRTALWKHEEEIRRMANKGAPPAKG